MKAEITYRLSEVWRDDHWQPALIRCSWFEDGSLLDRKAVAIFENSTDAEHFKSFLDEIQPDEKHDDT